MQTKFCRKCSRVRPRTEFSVDVHKVDGIRTVCSQCTREFQQRQRDARGPRHREYDKEYNRAWRRTPRGRRLSKDKSLRNNYGMTLEQYEQMLTSQDNSCATCKTKDPGGPHKIFQVDHDHETGAIRGLLCYRCNHGISCFRESVEIIEAVVDYLRADRSKAHVIPEKLAIRRGDRQSSN